MASEDGGLPRLKIAFGIVDPHLVLSGLPLSKERKERMEVADACFERGWSLHLSMITGRYWVHIPGDQATSAQYPTPLAAWTAATKEGS